MKNSTKSKFLALLAVGQATLSASAAIVSFAFSGMLTSVDNPTNALPANITNGLPFTGALTYDTSLILGGVDQSLSPDDGSYYFNANGGFFMSLEVGGHTFSTVQPSPGDPYATISIYNFADPFDEFAADASAPTIRLDGAPLPGIYTASGFWLDLEDSTGTAYATDALPAMPPQLPSFQAVHRVEISAYTVQAMDFRLIGNLANITAISPFPQLNIRAQPNQAVRLSWPLAVQGFSLQQNTNLIAGSGWRTNSSAVVDTATEHTVTVPASSSAGFFRLKSP